MYSGLGTNAVLRIMDSGWDASRHRGPLFARQHGVDLYTAAPITDKTFVIGAHVGDVDHRLEQQMVAAALQGATRGKVTAELASHAGLAVNPPDRGNYALVDRSINRSKGAVIQVAMTYAGGASLEGLMPLAAYALPHTKCFPYLVPIATAIQDAQDSVVAFFREHGVGKRVGSVSSAAGDQLAAILRQLRLQDIVDGQTDVRQTRAARAHKAKHGPRMGTDTAATARPVAGAGAGAGAAAESDADADSDSDLDSDAKVKVKAPTTRKPIVRQRRVRDRGSAKPSDVVAAARASSSVALDVRKALLVKAILARRPCSGV